MTVRVAKVTVNIGVGEGGEKLQKAIQLLEKITKRKPAPTKSRTRNPTFKIRKGQQIGAKVTLRKKEAEEFLKEALSAVDNKLSSAQFAKDGNFSFGVKEYIDLPATKYDPSIGLFGFDVCVTLEKPGYRVKRRRIARSKVGGRQKVDKEEAIKFIQQKFGVEVNG